MRDRLPAPRPRRFDEGQLAGVLITGCLLTVSGLLFLLGHALRAGDDNLAEINLPDFD